MGTSGNIPNLKLTRNLWEFTGILGNLLGIYWKFGEIYKTVSYTNININILFDYRLTCMQINTRFKNDFFGFLGGNLWCFFQDLLMNKNL